MRCSAAYTTVRYHRSTDRRRSLWRPSQIIQVVASVHERGPALGGLECQHWPVTPTPVEQELIDADYLADVGLVMLRRAKELFGPSLNPRTPD